jgi:hypothetical protein
MCLKYVLNLFKKDILLSDFGSPQGPIVRAVSRKSNGGYRAGGNVRVIWPRHLLIIRVKAHNFVISVIS